MGANPTYGIGQDAKRRDMIDPLTSNAWELQELLELGRTTSVALVELYLDQIHRHNHDGMNLRAMISIAPRDALLTTARILDEERRSQGSRGPLHGIPVIIKDIYNTASLNMDTTCGTTALKGIKTKDDAALVKKMIAAGMIILGKTNLTELNNFKGEYNTSGWSAMGGQTQSPYVRGGVLPNATFLGHSTTSGSSSGSCAGVAAGFAPIAFGAETDGSVIMPASRAALFALKVTPGSADMSGVCPGNPDFDCPGVFSKSAIDVINLWNTIFAPHSQFDLDREQVSWMDLRVGFVNGEEWQPANFMTEPNQGFKEQSIREMDAIADRIDQLGARVVRNVALPQTPEQFDAIAGQKFAAAIESYLTQFHNPPVKNLGDMIAWNLEHAEEELPEGQASQARLERYVASPMSSVEYDKIFQQVRQNIHGSVAKLFDDNGIDVILGPSDARICSVASAAGCPAGNVPLGYAEFNGRAHGLNLIARPNREHDLLRVLEAWENTFPELRQPPPILVNFP